MACDGREWERVVATHRSAKKPACGEVVGGMRQDVGGIGGVSGWRGGWWEVDWGKKGVDPGGSNLHWNPIPVPSLLPSSLILLRHMTAKYLA